MPSSIFLLDSYLIHSVTQFQNQFLDFLMIFFTKLGDLGLFWIGLAFVFLFVQKFRYYGVQILYGLSLNLLLGEGILKHLFHRVRPFQEFHDIFLKIPEPITSSFPSGHSSASFCFAVIFTSFFWKKSKLGVILVWMVAMMIVISRVYLQVHYPSDVAVGIMVGILSAIFALRFPMHISLSINK